MNPNELLENADTIVVINWPSKDVPEALALAGFHVYVDGGPGPEAYPVTRWRTASQLPATLAARHSARNSFILAAPSANYRKSSPPPRNGTQKRYGRNLACLPPA